MGNFEFSNKSKFKDYLSNFNIISILSIVRNSINTFTSRIAFILIPNILIFFRRQSILVFDLASVNVHSIYEFVGSQKYFQLSRLDLDKPHLLTKKRFANQDRTAPDFFT